MEILTGMRVVDLADENGELCGRLLADMGAEVVRVEPKGGAQSRSRAPFAGAGGPSLFFALRNAGKRSCALDLEDEADRERLHDLLAGADLMIESAQPGTLARLGLDAESLAARHPHLVVTSISHFGQHGPYADYVGTDMVDVAMGGMMHRAGVIEKPPVVIPGNLAYDVAGVAGVMGSLLALYKRSRTHRGQHIDVSAMEATAALADWSIPNFSLNPQVGHRNGAGIYTLYRCADGYMRMIILVKKHWHALLEWVGNPPELVDPKYDHFINRLIELDKIVAILEKFFEDKTKVEVAEEAQRRGIPSTPLLRPSEVLENAHTKARGTFRVLDVGGGVEARLPSGFYTVDGERVGPQTGPPALGEWGEGGWPPSGARRAFEAMLARDRVAPQDGYPLRGLRVIDCGVGAVGVECGRILAEYGARVIKIESAGAPDFIRTIMSSYMNPSFLSSSRSKEGFGVDLTRKEGVALVERLIRDADVFIENNGTGTTERLGLGPARLREINPRIVSFSSQSVGSYGPWKDWIGYGPNTHPVSGLQHLWNYPEDEDAPAGSTAVHPDHFVGRLGVVAVLAGLIAREVTGKGSHWDAAQFETPIGLIGDLLAKESIEPGSVHPAGNANPSAAPWGCYPCAGEDEWCVINVRDDADWQNLCGVLGKPDWSQASAYRTAAGRCADRDALDAKLGEWTAERAPRAVMEQLQAVAVPAGIVAHPGHHMADPQMAHRGFLKLVDQPEFEALLVDGPAFVGSDLPETDTRPAPMLGEHTRALAAELLGLAADEIESLVDAGVLEDPPTEYQP